MKLNLKFMTPFALALAGGLIFALPARAVTLWASGDWFDFGQQGGTSCGRAAAASLIYWWQRESKLKNPVDSTVDQIFAKLEKKFPDYSGDPATSGTFIHKGVEWYMGEFYPGVDLSEIYRQSPYFLRGVEGKVVSDYIKDCLSKGLLIGWDSGSHAQTCWGAEFDDATGLVSKVYITDPSTYSPQNTLEEMEVHPDSYLAGQTLSFIKKIEREDGTGYDMQTMDVRWLYTMTPIPEPSSAFLLGGVGLLALCASRRRRSRAK